MQQAREGGLDEKIVEPLRQTLDAGKQPAAADALLGAPRSP